MKDGNFFMMDKSSASLFPKDRPFTEFEALASFEMDRNNGNDWSIRGYEKLWGWPFTRVRRFINALLSPDGLTRIGSGRGNLQNPVQLISRNKRIKNESKTNHLNPLSTGNSEGKRIENESKTNHTIETKTKTKEKHIARSDAPDSISIPLKDGSEWTVPEEYIGELESCYPGFDVRAELPRIRIWNISNPSKRKTRRGIRKHISSWIDRKSNDLASQTHTGKPDCKTCDHFEGGKCPHFIKPPREDFDPKTCGGYRRIAK